VKQGLPVEELTQYSSDHALRYINSDVMKGWVNHVVNTFHSMNPLIFRQYLETTSSTYTYLLADAVTKEAILIDPVLETVDRYASTCLLFRFLLS
jgi:hypothetical protein